MKNENSGTNAAEFHNCTFTGVEFDKSVVGTMSSIAEGLIENAKGLKALAEVFSASHIQVETMVHVADGSVYTEATKD